MGALLLWRQGASTSLEGKQPGRVCLQSPGTPGHMLPVGLLERHFLSRDRHLPSHSKNAAPIQPTTHGSSAASVAQSSALPFQQ